MSSGVVRGEATAAQRHVDALLAAGARASLPQLMHRCLAADPTRVFMRNGSTGAAVTCGELLRRSVGLARALRGRGAGEAGAGAAGAEAAGAGAGEAPARAVLVARGSEHALAAYLGLLFAGTLPFLADPVCTPHELQYYMELVEPSVVLCDAATERTARAAAAHAPALRVLCIHDGQLDDLVKDYCADIDDYRVPDAERFAPMVMLPTSGSTGMPKAALYHHEGLIQQLAHPWAYHSQFPRPTERVMVLTTPQWATFTMMLTTCCVFQVELLLSPEQPTVEHVLHMMHTYKPTWTFFGPAFAKALAAAGEPRHFASLETVTTLGSHVTPEILAALKAKLPASCHVADGYGLTEAQGFVAVSDPAAPPASNGFVANILHYKLVKEDGTEAAVGEEGELYLKGDCIIRGYFKREQELAQSLAAGWLRTGDAFARDAAGRLYYRRRIKFSFKHNNQLVCPEEVEGVVESLRWVAQSAVCEARAGPAAAVVLAPGAPPEDDARRAIHERVQARLSSHKRLVGGVAFVPALPLTHTGKLHRAKCADMLAQLPPDRLRY